MTLLVWMKKLLLESTKQIEYNCFPQNSTQNYFKTF